MNDQDGACGSGDVRDSLSFCSLGFDVFNMGCIAVGTDGNCIAGEVPNKYHGPCNTKTGDCPGAAPALPITSHETGNYNTSVTFELIYSVCVRERGEGCCYQFSSGPSFARIAACRACWMVLLSPHRADRCTFLT